MKQDLADIHESAENHEDNHFDREVSLIKEEL